MNTTAKLPIGIENFKEIRTEGFYYVDKTGLIKELLDNWGKVNLFTRPRRFGKSLNMSMLRFFFEYGCDPGLFDGLKINEEKDLCREYMGKFPVISITLKGVDARNYETARSMLCSTIGKEAMRFQFLSESDRLSGKEKAQYDRLTTVGEGEQAEFIMSDGVLTNSLLTLSQLLHRHYGQKVILLIDEYDVPLDKAQQSGYYEDMASLIRNLFGQALKGNDSIYFAVLTGCLRISKESIFTGLNNLRTFSITNIQFDEHFGFSDREVRTMLDFYNLSDKYGTVKEWYDGYHFGNKDIYCPWDVINYCAELRADAKAIPKAYWSNTSGNDIIRSFLQKATPQTRREIERLVNGETIVKKIDQELTYVDLYKSADHIWSVLFATGYLTPCGESDGEAWPLAIPNLEIQKIFTEHIMEWFQAEIHGDTHKVDAFCTAFANADAEAVEAYFNAYLAKTISIRDTGVRKNKKENFYHGILFGLLSCREDWEIDSNAESGDGFSDILVEIKDRKVGIVIEIKYPDHGNLEAGCVQALEQIETKGYGTKLLQDGMTNIIKYGIACNKKNCRVMLAEAVL